MYAAMLMMSRSVEPMHYPAPACAGSATCATVGAAFQFRLNPNQALVIIIRTTLQSDHDIGFTHVEAGAHPFALRHHGHRRLGARGQQVAPEVIYQGMLLQQGLEPRFGTRVASHHACAAKLLTDGLSLKRDWGSSRHRSTSATMTYTKIDLAALREVGDFDLGDLP